MFVISPENGLCMLGGGGLLDITLKAAGGTKKYIEILSICHGGACGLFLLVFFLLGYVAKVVLFRDVIVSKWPVDERGLKRKARLGLSLTTDILLLNGGLWCI